MNNCILIPTKKNLTTNQEEDSRLFNSLLSLVDKSEGFRNKVVSAYLKVTNPEFIEKYKNELTFDELGEPTLDSLLKFTDIEDIFDESAILHSINQELGALELEDTIENYNKLVSKMIDFNNNSKYRYARVVNINRVIKDGASKLVLSIDNYNENTLSKAKDTENAYNLNNKIKNILSKQGVDIVAYDGLFNSLATIASTKFEASQESAKGLSVLIQLANNSLGEASLPEEFSHYVFETFSNESITQRLVSYINKYDLDRDILGDSYESYYERYNGNKNLLVREAVAHLIREEIFRNHDISTGQLQSLSERLKTIFKNRFSKLSSQEIDAAIKDISNDVSEISREAFNETRELKNRINEEVSFDSIESKIKKDINILNNIIDTEVKKAYIYDKNADENWVKKRKDFIQELKKNRDSSKNTQIVGIYIFLNQVAIEFNKLKDRLSNFDIQEGEDYVTTKARLLRQIKNYTSSYMGILHDIQNIIRENTEDDENYYSITVKDKTIQLKALVDENVGMLSHLNKIYEDEASRLFLEFAKPFMGDNIVIPFDNAIKGRKKGDVVKIEDFYDFENKKFKDVSDISFLDRWLNGISYSHDWFNKIFGAIVKQQNTKTRLETIDMSKRLTALGTALSKKEINDLSFVFERDNDGNLTLNFISQTNWGQYRKDKFAKWNQLKEKYGDYEDLSVKKQKEYKKEYDAWIDDNTRWDKKRGLKIPKSKEGEKYYNKEFEKLVKDKDKYDAYKQIVSIKEELDSYLPISGQARHQAPIIMKDLLERIKSSNDIKDGWVAITESLKDEVLRRSGNIEYGSDDYNPDGYDVFDDEARDAPYITRPLDFEKQPLNILPIYYQRLRGDIYDKKTGRILQRGDNANDVSTDIISTLCAYAQMAYNYKNMNEVIDAMEIGRDVLDKNQDITIEEGGIPVIEHIKHLGQEIVNKSTSNNSSNIKQQRDDFFAAHVYGRYFANAGTIKILGKTVDLQKLANLSNKLTSLNGLAFNPLAGMANIDQGVITMNIEAFSREFFTERNLLHADTRYAQLLPECISEVGKVVKANKLDLLSEKYNVLQDYDQKIRDVNFDRKNRLVRMFGSNFLYVFNNAGEHWMQHRTFFSLVDSDKEQLIDKDGQKISIDDANEIMFIQEDGSLGSENKDLGAKLVLKQGLKTQDGLTIITDEQIKAGHKVSGNEIEEWKFTNYITRKCATINQRMHGIYNTEDMNAFQRLAIGRMAMIFRKWIVPSIEKRYDSVNYNFETQSWNEGYYRTAVRIFKKMYDDIKEGQFVYATFKDELSEQEKANMRRCITEVAQFIGILAGLMIIKGLDDDDKNNAEDKSWIISLIEYKLYRMRTEIGALMPTPLLPQEFFRLVQTPTADVRLWQTTLDLLSLLNPLDWRSDEEHALKSGRFKGHSKNYKKLHNSILDPFENDLYNILHPWEPLAFYK